MNVFLIAVPYLLVSLSHCDSMYRGGKSSKKLSFRGLFPWSIGFQPQRHVTMEMMREPIPAMYVEMIRKKGLPTIRQFLEFPWVRKKAILDKSSRMTAVLNSRCPP
jgi:hypothetical protein